MLRSSTSITFKANRSVDKKLLQSIERAKSKKAREKFGIISILQFLTDKKGSFLCV